MKAGEPGIVEGRLRRAVVAGQLLLECWPDGTLIFAARDEYLCWGMSGAPPRINPLALAESTYLFAELARRVYEHARPSPQEVAFNLSLLRFVVEGQLGRLGRGRLKSMLTQFGVDIRTAPGADADFEETVAGEWPPGRVAYVLLARLYTWFGFTEDDVPYVVEIEGEREISAELLLKDGS